MVILAMNIRKRRNIAFNNTNFVGDPIPIGVNIFGLPIFKEITNTDFFDATDYSNNHYKKLNTTDDYGFFDTLYVRGGIRRQIGQEFTMTVKQDTVGGNEFQMPVFMVSFPSARLVQFDGNDDAVAPIPLYDYFTADFNLSMLSTGMQNEFKTTLSGSVHQTIEESFVVPPSPLIDKDANLVRQWIPHDHGLVTSWEHVSSLVLKNSIFTTHKVKSIITFRVPDTSNLPEGIGLEIKFDLFFFKHAYPNSEDNNNDPILLPIPADDIISIQGGVNII